MVEDKKTREQAKRLTEFADRLFGDVADMSKEEVDELYAAIAPTIDPRAQVYEIAAKAAQQYRLRGEDVPPHVQVALNATKTITNQNDGKLATLREIVAKAMHPTLGPAKELSYSFRGKKELSDSDQNILEDLSEKMRDDWKEDDPT